MVLAIITEFWYSVIVSLHPGLATPTIAPTSITTEASTFLRDAIVAGVWPPGTRIPELEVAAQLGISRTPLREALRALFAEGLVDAVPRTGYVVHAHTASELQDVYQARGFFEGEAAHRAATLMEESELWSLESCVTESRRLDEQRQDMEKDTLVVLTNANSKFHTLILEGSRSSVFRRIVGQLMVRPLAYRAYNWYTPEERRRSRQEHADILAALMDRDADRARSLMIEHTAQIARVVTTRAFASATSSPIPGGESGLTAHQRAHTSVALKKPPIRKQERGN